MPIQHNPKPGDLLQCDFTLHANPRDPEMGKARPVIVLARPTNGLVIIVPISSKQPAQLRTWHKEMDFSDWPPNLHNQCWAKCDMVLTVADWRLDRYFKRDQYGKRKYQPYRAKTGDFEAIKAGVVAALAFGN
jgi:uncharacterized protein YifN (PemK superfamily)